MQKWEYTHLAASEGHLMLAQEYGKQGWELVAVTTMFTSFYFFFKRPLKGDN